MLPVLVRITDLITDAHGIDHLADGGLDLRISVIAAGLDEVDPLRQRRPDQVGSRGAYRTSAQSDFGNFQARAAEGAIAHAVLDG